jgi:two-component system, OmpR family, response regulator
MRVLVVEDDADIGDAVRRGLEETGILAEWAADAGTAILAAEQGHFDVIVLDVMLGRGMDGFELCHRLRGRAVPSAILMLTARDAVPDRVRGLEAGADDYLVKPFAFSELLARVNALLRRPPVQAEKTVLRVSDLELDLIRRTAKRAGKPIDLQPREFTLLEVLMRNEGRVVTRTMLLERVWDFQFDPKTSVVDTHISRLRAKIDKPFGQPLVHTVRNIGYSLHAPR